MPRSFPRIPHLLPTCLALALLAPPAFAATCHLPASARARTPAALRQMERTWVAALRHHDASTVACILAPGFIDTNWQGLRRSRPEILTAAGKPSKFTQAIALDRVRLAGNTGIAWGTNLVRNSVETIVVRLRFTDVFVYREHRWYAVAAQETKEMIGNNP